MIRTRAQLEADAIERLKSLRGGTFSYKDAAKAVGVNGYVSADTFRDKLLELLTDNAVQLRIEFKGDEVPWICQLPLNGRSIQGVYVNGELFERVKECELEYHDTGWVSCCECGTSWENDRPYVYRRCPYCGAKVVKKP